MYSSSESRDSRENAAMREVLQRGDQQRAAASFGEQEKGEDGDEKEDHEEEKEDFTEYDSSDHHSKLVEIEDS